MTVQELIKKLSFMNPESTVKIQIQLDNGEFSNLQVTEIIGYSQETIIEAE